MALNIQCVQLDLSVLICLFMLRWCSLAGLTATPTSWISNIPSLLCKPLQWLWPMSLNASNEKSQLLELWILLGIGMQSAEGTLICLFKSLSFIFGEETEISPGVHCERKDSMALHCTMLSLELVQYALAAVAKDVHRLAFFWRGSQWLPAMPAGPKKLSFR